MKRKTSSYAFGAAVLVAGLALSSCAASAPEPDADGEVQLESQLVIAGVGGATGEAFQAGLAEFTAETGVEIIWVEGLGSDHVGRLVAQKNSPEIDLLQGDMRSHYAALPQGIWAEIDGDRLSNLADFPAEYAHLKDGAIAPFYDYVGIWYNEARLAENGLEAPDTWDDFFDLLAEPALANHAIMPSIDNGYLLFWLASLSDDASDPSDALKRLAAVDSAVYEFARTPATMFDLAMSGQGWIGINGGSRILDMSAADPDIKLVVPVDAPVGPRSWSLVQDGPNPNAAYALLDWLMTPEGQQALATRTGENPILSGIDLSASDKSFISDEQAKRIVSWDYRALAENGDTYRQLFTEIVGRAGIE